MTYKTYKFPFLETIIYNDTKVNNKFVSFRKNVEKFFDICNGITLQEVGELCRDITESYIDYIAKRENIKFSSREDSKKIEDLYKNTKITLDVFIELRKMNKIGARAHHKEPIIYYLLDKAGNEVVQKGHCIEVAINENNEIVEIVKEFIIKAFKLESYEVKDDFYYTHPITKTNFEQISYFYTIYDQKLLCKSKTNDPLQISNNSILTLAKGEREEKIERMVSLSNIEGCACGKILSLGQEGTYYYIDLQNGEKTLDEKLKDFQKNGQNISKMDALDIVIRIIDICLSLQDIKLNNKVYSISHRNICQYSILIDDNKKIRLAFFEKAKIYIQESRQQIGTIGDWETSEKKYHTSFSNVGCFIHPYIKKENSKLKNVAISRENSIEMDIYSCLILLLYLLFNGNVSQVDFSKKETRKRIKEVLSKNYGEDFSEIVGGYLIDSQNGIMYFSKLADRYKIGSKEKIRKDSPMRSLVILYDYLKGKLDNM